MATFDFQPIADWLNQGWALVGSGVAQLFQALNNSDDAKYCICPASKGSGTIRFPVDTSSVPEGAVIVSVTIKARVGLGSGNAPGGVAPSVTFSLSASDNTARFTTRTIYPGVAAADFEVATYGRDALGLSWDVHRLNHILCRFFSYTSIYDLIRLYRLYCVINYRTRPAVTITAPTGTVETPSPVLSWTYSQADGDPQKSVEYKIFTGSQRNQVGFNPEISTPVYIGHVEGELTSLTLPTSIDPDTYWLYVQAESSFGAKSTWTGRQFQVNGPAPGIPGVPDPNGLISGAGVISVVPDAQLGAAALTMQDTSNILSAQAADAESTIEAGQLAGYLGTVARSTDVAFPGGTASWKVTSTSAATTVALTDWIEVTPGAMITATGQFRAASTTRSCRVRFLFYDEDFTQLSGTFEGDPITDSASTWLGAHCTVQVPTGAVYGRACYDLTSTGNGEVHYLDRLSVSYGESTAWSDGGQASRNLLSDWYSSPDGTAGDGESWLAGSTVTTTTSSTSGTGASGTTRNEMEYVGLAPSIAYRAVGTAFTSGTSGASITLNRPAGVQQGDLMVAFVTAATAVGTLSVPDGWTQADMIRVNDGGPENQTMWVLKRTAGSSEPSTWTDGFLSANYARRSAIVIAYSGAADASEQFLASSQVSNTNNTPMFSTCPAVNNTDPNAWRLMAFSVDDNASGGTLTANKLQPAVAPDISYVGKATSWAWGGQGSSSYQINRPAGVQEGDLMIATVFLAGHVTFTAPSGWTKLEDHQVVTSAPMATACVMYRVAGSSEPSSWTGSVAGSTRESRVVQCSAYRNVDTSNPFIASEINGASSGNAGYTSTAVNTDARAWTVVAFGAGKGTTGAFDFSGDSGLTERSDNSVTYSAGWPIQAHQTIGNAMFDSGGPVAAGDQKHFVSAGASYVIRYGWIGILRPLSTPPSPIANETARQVAAIGASNPYMTLRVFDSNGTVPTGNQSISGVWSPGSGSDMNNMAGWQGLILPAAPVTGGYGVASMETPVELSLLDPQVLELCDRKVTVTAAFLGSRTGTPYLAVNFYRANVLLRQDVAQGEGYDTSIWRKSAATFDIPEGTTRMGVEVSASDMEIGDLLYWDRVSLSLGSSQGYRPGTSRGTHPVWSRPSIEYADDAGAGYSEFEALPGSVTRAGSFDPADGYAYFVDHTVIPLTNRKYRARTVVYGLAGDRFVSRLGPESSEFSFEAANWWLKDIAEPANNLQLKVAWEDVQVGTTNTATVFQPLGSSLPVVLSEGYKGDTFSLRLRPVTHDGWALLRSMVLSGRTLFLQSDIDHAWFVRPTGDLQSVVLATQQRRSNPLREITVSFVQVEAQE